MSKISINAIEYMGCFNKQYSWWFDDCYYYWIYGDSCITTDQEAKIRFCDVSAKPSMRGRTTKGAAKEALHEALCFLNEKSA